MHTNKSWNFLEKKDQDKLITLLARRPTQLLIALRPQMIGESEMTQEHSDHGVPLHVAVRASRFQMKTDRYFIFEHPREAASWTDRELAALMQEDSVEVVELIGTAPAQKGSRLLTNMQAAQ